MHMCHIGGNSCLKASSKVLGDPDQLGQTDDLAFGKIGDMGTPVERN
jgi:hypothetical protein